MSNNRTNVRLDDRARKDAELLIARYGLSSISAAVRFALRELARNVEQKEQQSDR